MNMPTHFYVVFLDLKVYIFTRVLLTAEKIISMIQSNTLPLYFESNIESIRVLLTGEKITVISVKQTHQLPLYFASNILGTSAKVKIKISFKKYHQSSA